MEKNGQDWLSLGERQNKSLVVPAKNWSYRIGSKSNCAGTSIYQALLTYVSNKSGPEGIQENDVF